MPFQTPFPVKILVENGEAPWPLFGDGNTDLTNHLASSLKPGWTRDVVLSEFDGTVVKNSHLQVAE